MKKTTLAIIGLSVCVVALTIALVVIIIQKKTETIIATDPDLFMYEPNNIMHMMFVPKSWQKNNLFSISSDYTKTKSYYYNESSGKTFIIEKWYQSKDDLKVPQRP
jgi:hypothetical protein